MTASSQEPEEAKGRTPQEEDPFGYLYRPAEGEDPAVQPRTAYRPMEVGRAQYGQQAYGLQPPRPQAAHPPRPGAEATTELPHQQPRYAERSRPQPGEVEPRGRGKAPVFGVVAVVAAIAIGSGIALSGNDGKAKNEAGPGPAPSAGHASSSAPSSPSPAASAPSSTGAPGNGFLDASKAQAQGAQLAATVKGAISADGSYLTLQQGTSATWTVTVPTAGQYKFWIHYSNNGEAVKTAVTVNGQDHPGGTTFKSWSKGGDQSQSWSYTNIWPQLQAGTNAITVSPAGGPVLVDQVAVTGMDANGDYPSPAAAG
ncbi:hypothetical protein C7C46_06705 [Streptomyces tateyamensis]|uniref:CBM6 domain-containing protein n=1 Tax=Streptomyces tateyamensis TaxID=565073 RepID=A0A2V4P5G3_9ACTN|nr:hypothetical protein [Streptomyces tateyamensis]PYC85425.1 hypothetical protein C7C46_06705 [Streptomyces tateyamensis]